MKGIGLFRKLQPTLPRTFLLYLDQPTLPRASLVVYKNRSGSG